MEVREAVLRLVDAAEGEPQYYHSTNSNYLTTIVLIVIPLLIMIKTTTTTNTNTNNNNNNNHK